MRAVGLTDSDVGERSVLGGKMKQDTDGGDVISFFSSFPSRHWLGSILTSSGDGTRVVGEGGSPNWYLRGTRQRLGGFIGAVARVRVLMAAQLHPIVHGGLQSFLGRERGVTAIQRW